MRSPIHVGLVVLVLVAGLLTARNLLWEPVPTPASEPPLTGVQCDRAGGEISYCRCLDQMNAARQAAHLPVAHGLPPRDHPAVRYARGHRRLYPIITVDTPNCLTVRRRPHSHAA
jgi:hypothetical protein